MSLLKAVRGTRDLLPPETELWNHIEATARRTFARYGFGEIRTPVFEDTQLFARGVGEETDIVSKEMYTWEDRERFEAKKMKESWTEAHRDRIFVQETSSAFLDLHRLGVDRQILRRDTATVEFVCFRPKISASAIKTLKRAKILARGEFRDEYQNLPLDARLVVPPGSGKSSSSVDLDEVLVEEFAGKYFSSAQSLTLRPENTAGVVRAYIEHKLGETGLLQKLYYIGPQFRRERPQKGRYRQFFQIGAEVIGPPSSGSESPLRDAEVIEMLATFLNELGITGWTLLINSVGSPADRPGYVEALRAALKPVVGQMCVDCQRRAETNPLRVLDCKVPEDQPIIEKLPQIWDSLDEASKQHFQQVCAALDVCGVPYTHSHRLVRGLDYYTRTTFEFTHGGLGAQNALLGGGRYDGLSEALGGPRAPGIGFAIGEDRLVLTLQAQGAQPAQLADAYVAPVGEAMNAPALVLARDLRREGLRVELGDGAARVKKSLETANKLARAIVILGQDELQSGNLTVKNFATGEQSKIERANLSAHLATLGEHRDVVA